MNNMNNMNNMNQFDMRNNNAFDSSAFNFNGQSSDPQFSGPQRSTGTGTGTATATQKSCIMQKGTSQKPDRTTLYKKLPNMLRLEGSQQGSCEAACLREAKCETTTFNSATGECELFSGNSRMWDSNKESVMMYKSCNV